MQECLENIIKPQFPEKLSFQTQFPKGELAGLSTYSSCYPSFCEVTHCGGCAESKATLVRPWERRGSLITKGFEGICAFRVSGSENSTTSRMQSGVVRLCQSPCVIPPSFPSLYFIEFHLLLQATRDKGQVSTEELATVACAGMCTPLNVSSPTLCPQTELFP